MVGMAAQSVLADRKYSVPSSHHGDVFDASLKYIVIHLAVCCSGKPQTAHNLARYASRSDRPKASWHYNVDSEAIVQSLDERHIGWHTGAFETNNRSLGVEMCVYMPSSRSEWMGGYYEGVVLRTAELTADLCKRHSVPMKGLSRSELASGESGVISHNLSRLVFGGTTHVDPGPHFPWQFFMEKVREFDSGAGVADPPVVEPEPLVDCVDLLEGVKASVLDAVSVVDEAIDKVS